MITGAIAEAARRLHPDTIAARRHALERDLKTVERELANPTRAIKAGGRRVESLVAEVETCDARKRVLQADLARLAQADGLASLDLRRIEQDLRVRLEDWRGLLTRHVGAARQIPAKLIPDRLVFTPHVEGDARYYTFTGIGRIEPLLQGVVALPPMLAGGERLVRQGWGPQRDSNPCFRHDHVFAI